METDAGHDGDASPSRRPSAGTVDAQELVIARDQLCGYGPDRRLSNRQHPVNANTAAKTPIHLTIDSLPRLTLRVSRDREHRFHEIMSTDFAGS
jgi:hypothetical protein